MSTKVAENEAVQQDVAQQVEKKVGAQLPPSSASGKSAENGKAVSAQSTGMQPAPITKYRPFQTVHLPDRTWPDKQIVSAPMWCSVDLRDGNQALAIPMSVEEKLEYFDLLVRIGFKEIEVGFPSASQIEFDFIRRLIDEDRIPEDVTIQILVQAREELIRRSFESLRGARRAVVHMYNSTNPAQRRIVFGMSKEEIKAIAVQGATLIQELVEADPNTDWVLEYTPESFVLTETDFALEVCEAVIDVWKPTPQKRAIINLPTTVESSTPNVHADQIEWFCRNIRDRDSVIISLHTHNDRGTGVAATELALMAGADRVEGTLFGNGERTGNLDIVTVALNMYSQGVHPNLDFSDLPAIREVYERTTRMEVPARQPYGGDLVFTAFSGSHQDAISKGFKVQRTDTAWEVPYLPIDPKDIGRTYEAIIRYNSQSGKGGAAWLMEQDFGFILPKLMQKEFGVVINKLADTKGHELSGNDIYKAFVREYIKRTSPVEVLSFQAAKMEESTGRHRVECSAKLLVNGAERDVKASGNGPIDAFVGALREAGLGDFGIASYSEHSLSEGEEAKAVAYIEIKTASGKHVFGAAVDTDIEFASIKAIASALNRSQALEA